MLRNGFSVTWRFALQLLLVALVAVIGMTILTRWSMVVLEDRWVARYQVPPNKLIEVVVLQRLLEVLPPAAHPAELARLNQSLTAIGQISVVGLRELPQWGEMSADDRDALMSGRLVVTRAEQTRPNRWFTQFQRLGNSDSVLVVSLVPAAFYSASELRFMERLDDIAALGRAITIFLIVGICLIPFYLQSRALLRATTELEAGNFGVCVRMSRTAALYPLARALNVMAARIVAMIASQKALVDAAAHELRTPLTRLRYAQQMAASAPDAATQRQFLSRIDLEAHALNELVSELLFYARLDHAEGAALNVQWLDTAQWARTSVHEARQLAAAIGRDITIQFEVEVERIKGDPSALAKLVSNLLGNAVRYARTSVALRVGREADRYCVAVDDDGAGIAIADRQRVLQPFVRLAHDTGDGTATRTGLGLAIVARIAAMHHGTAEVLDSPLGGTQVRVTWPATLAITETSSTSHDQEQR